MTYVPVESAPHDPLCRKGLGLQRDLDPEECARCAALRDRYERLRPAKPRNTARPNTPSDRSWIDQGDGSLVPLVPPIAKVPAQRRHRRRWRRALVAAGVVGVGIWAAGWSDNNGCPSRSTYYPDTIEETCIGPTGATVCVLSAPYGSPSAPWCDRRKR